MADQKKRETSSLYANMYAEPSDESTNEVESVSEISCELIDEFVGHPFKVKMDNKMLETIESVSNFGVLIPTIIRPKENGRYEMVAGHRRLMASKEAGKDTIPAIIRDLTDEAATIIMVDSNLQNREEISPSEKAMAYKMKMEAIKRQGKRSDLTSRQVGEKLSAAEVGAVAGDSARQVQRYIRLTELDSDLLEMVDNNDLGLTTAVELSYLPPESQKSILNTMTELNCSPSIKQAKEMKELSNNGELTANVIIDLLSETKANQKESFKIVFDDTTRKVIPRGVTPKEVNSLFNDFVQVQYGKRESPWLGDSLVFRIDDGLRSEIKGKISSDDLNTLFQKFLKTDLARTLLRKDRQKKGEIEKS